MKNLVTRLDSALAVLCLLFEFFAAGLLMIMLVINAVNIFSRTVFDASLNWVWPWTMVLFIWWVLIAFFPLYRRKKDVSIYFILRHDNPKLTRVLGVIVYCAILTAMLVLLITGPQRLASASGTIEIVGLPRFVLVVPLIVSTALIALDAFVNLFRIASGIQIYSPFGKIEITQ